MMGLTVAPANITKSNEIPHQLLRDLKLNLVMRQVSSGIELLDAHAHLFTSIDPAQRHAAAFVCCVAQWVDIGYGNPELLERLLARFSRDGRASLPVADYLQLRMAEGLFALLRDHPDEALRHFDLVLSLRDEMEDQEAVAIAHFWNGRCHPLPHGDLLRKSNWNPLPNGSWRSDSRI